MIISEFPININSDNFYEDVKPLINEIRPYWNTNNLKIMKFTNGISNILFGVFYDDEFTDKTDVILVRIYGRTLLNRDIEIENMSELSKLDLAAKVWGKFRNGCAYQYIHGTLLTIDELREGHFNKLIIVEFVKLHTTKLNLNRPVQPFLFSKMRELAEGIPYNLENVEKNEKYLLKFPRKSRLLQEINCLEELLVRSDYPIAFCHNDLLIHNIIINLNKDRVHFIDFEYSDYNFIGFDIGNHFNEYAGLENVDYSKYPDEIFQKKWLREYLELLNMSNSQSGDAKTVSNNDIDHWYKMANKFSLASHLIWCMWSILQDTNSKIDFNYLDYGILRWNQYVKKKDEFLSL